jgi:hypothetical protein
MTYPTPSEMTPRDWGNYLASQLASSALGTIPRHTLAMGVEPGNSEITVHFQLTEVDEQDEEDMTEIIDELAISLGDVVMVRKVVDVRSTPHVNPFQGIWWTYSVRTDDGLKPEDS